MSNAATPIELLISFYDNAIAAIHRALGAVRQGDPGALSRHVTLAVAIVHQLAESLDFRFSPALARSLLRQYTDVASLLVRANQQRSTEPLTQAAQTLSTLRSAWVEIEKRSASELRN